MYFYGYRYIDIHTILVCIWDVSGMVQKNLVKVIFSEKRHFGTEGQSEVGRKLTFRISFCHSARAIMKRKKTFHETSSAGSIYAGTAKNILTKKTM